MLASSLALQQTVRVVAVALVASLLFLLGQGVWQIEAAKRDFDQQRAQTAASLRSGVSNALFNFDADMARAILKDVLESRPVNRLEVVQAGDRPFVVEGSDQREGPQSLPHAALAWLLDLDRRDVLTLDESDLNTQTRWRGTLGRVHITFDDSTFVARIADRLANQSMVLLFMILVVAAATSLVMHAFISRHVVAIARHMSAIHPDRPDAHPLPVPQRHERNELGRLLRRFNGLLHRLARAQGALEASETKYKTIVERTPVAMVVNDPETGDIQEVNATACDMLGYDRPELLAMSMNQLLLDDPDTLREARLAILDRRARQVTTCYRTKSGAIRNGEIFASAISLAGSQRIFNVMIDVTERLRVERDRDEALQMALSSKKAQADFLASMSHELRTPLNAILGFAEVIKGELMGPIGVPQYSVYAEDIHASGSHLLSLINDILDLSRIETGHAPIEAVPLNLRHEINKAVKIVEQRLQDNRLDLTIELNPSSIELLADRRSVRQMLINLLSNAAKFTPPGGSITVSACQDEVGVVRVAVADTGIGIAAKDHERIFQAFRQAINTETREIEGSGLGLALVKSLVQRHGGDVELVSAPDQGSTFTLVFPPVPPCA